MAYTRTCLEEKMYTILSSLHIDFTEQVSTRSGFIIDFAIYIDRKANRKIALEVDGSQWHTKPQQRKRDAFRDRILRKEGWTVIRFGEVFTKDEVSQRLHESGVMPG